MAAGRYSERPVMGPKDREFHIACRGVSSLGLDECADLLSQPAVSWDGIYTHPDRTVLSEPGPMCLGA
jgi:hypothetical protein